MEKWTEDDAQQLRSLHRKLVEVAHQQREAGQTTDALVEDAHRAQSDAGLVSAVCSWATSRLGPSA